MKTVDSKLTVSEHRLDTPITDITDAVYLNCIHEIGKITYREALDRYNSRMTAIKKLVEGVLGVSEIK
jgi:hypothetical protein